MSPRSTTVDFRRTFPAPLRLAPTPGNLPSIAVVAAGTAVFESAGARPSGEVHGSLARLYKDTRSEVFTLGVEHQVSGLGVASPIFQPHPSLESLLAGSQGLMTRDVHSLEDQDRPSDGAGVPQTSRSRKYITRKQAGGRRPGIPRGRDITGPRSVVFRTPARAARDLTQGVVGLPEPRETSFIGI